MEEASEEEGLVEPHPFLEMVSLQNDEGFWWGDGRHQRQIH